MGLDMYLSGEKHFLNDWQHPENNQTEDGFRLTGKTLSLGYWRKHPNLHGYIVQTFAEGKDECQRIELSSENLENILDAIKADKLLPTSGFFFGESDASDKEPSIKIIQGAIDWLAAQEATPTDSEKATSVLFTGRPPMESVYRSVVYQASW